MHETESFEAILERARNGDPEAQNAMGRLVLSRGGPNARAEAEDWFLRAAEQGLPEAKHNLGVLYLPDESTRPKALTWFRAAAKDGWLASSFAIGAILRAAGRTAEAQRFFETAARRGHAAAQDALGRIYFERDTEADHVIARRWSALAANQGVADAQTRLGTIFHEGLGTARDPQRAAAYFRAAACQGHAGAQLMIGGAYDVGVGVVRDKIEAAHWVLRSAEQGNELAQAYVQTLMKDLQQHEIDEAVRRSRQPLPSPSLPKT